MQLISLLMFLFSLILLFGALLFVVLWLRNHRKVSIMYLLREDIGHIGVSAVVEYPETPAPLVALLEEEYPRSEAIVITDLQQTLSPFVELIKRYHLIAVNHSHLSGVRALYRSRHRAYRRAVVVDLPVEYCDRASYIGRAVASYDYILYLQGESIVEHDAITYCANVAATQSLERALSLQSLVGTGACLERGPVAESQSVSLRSEYPLAWRKSTIFVALSAVLLPSVLILIAHLSKSWLMLAASVMIALVVALFLYVSSCVTTKKSLLARLDTVLRNYWRWITRRESRIHDTPLRPSRVQVQNRPVHYHEDARQGR